MQIRALFNGRVDSDTIDAALERLMSLSAVNRYTEPTRGRPTTVWSMTADAQPAPEQAEPALQGGT